MGNPRDEVEIEAEAVSSKIQEAVSSQRQIKNCPQLNDQSSNNNAIGRKHTEDGAFDDVDNNTCYVCRKRFPSDKALFGHMRLHPDRGWKGIRPPRRFSIEKASSMSDLGRAEESDAVHNIMILSGRDTQELSLNKKRKEREELEAENEDFATKKAKNYEDFSSGKVDEVGVLKQASEEVDINNKKYNTPSMKFSCRTNISDKIRRKRALRALLTEDLIDYTKKMKSRPTVRFTCITCKKTFPTHQALVGHRASHKKDEIEGDQCAATDPLPGNNGARLNSGMDPTGQALGGHQRHHLKAPVEDAVSSVTTQEDKRLLDFDLNELPPVEGDCNLQLGYVSSL